MSVSVTIQDEGLNRALDGLRAKLGDMRPLMLEISQILLYEVEENFAQEGRPKWTPLAQATVKERQRQGYWPGKILQRSGALAASITPSYGDDFAQISTNKKYAAIQNFGGTIERKAESTRLHFKRHDKGKYKGRTLFSRVKDADFSRTNTKDYEINIPARPFMPIDADGNLSESMRGRVLGTLVRYAGI